MALVHQHQRVQPRLLATGRDHQGQIQAGSETLSLYIRREAHLLPRALKTRRWRDVADSHGHHRRMDRRKLLNHALGALVLIAIQDSLAFGFQCLCRPVQHAHHRRIVWNHKCRQNLRKAHQSAPLIPRHHGDFLHQRDRRLSAFQALDPQLPPHLFGQAFQVGRIQFQLQRRDKKLRSRRQRLHSNFKRFDKWRFGRDPHQQFPAILPAIP